MEQQAGQLVGTVAAFRLQAGPAVRAAEPLPVAAVAASRVVALPSRTPPPRPAPPPAPARKPRAPRASAALAADVDGEWQEF
jgi:hypothetical protein